MAPAAADAVDLPTARAPALSVTGTASMDGAAIHQDDTFYDLAPVEAAHPELAPLMAAWRSRNHRVVLQLAPRLARRTDKVVVRVSALYVLARTHDRRRRGQAAERVWRRIAQDGPLADRARLRLAELALRRDDVDAAIGALAAVSPWHVGRLGARLRIAELEVDRGQMGPAAAVLEKLDPATMSSKDAARWRLLSGDVARRRGQEEQAARRYLAVWRTGARKYRANALERLAAMGQPPGPMDRMERLIRNAPRRWHRGRRGRKQRRAYYERLERLADGVPGLADYGQGLLQKRHRSLRARAAATLTKALAEAQDGALRAGIRYALGDLLGRLSKDTEAIATLEPLVAEGRDGPLTVKALWRLRRLYNAVNRSLDVDRVLQRLLVHPNAGHLRQVVTWTAAWRRFRVGDCDESLRLLKQLASDPSATFNHGRQSWRARSEYWQARCHDRNGRTQQAIALWRSVVQSHPLTWYGALALDRIRETDPQLAARLLGQPPAASTNNEAPRVEQLRVHRQQTLAEAALLVRLGESRSASRLLQRQLRAGLSSGGVHLLATLYELAGRSRMAFATLQRFTRVAARPDPSTVSVWRLAFPTPWPDLFKKAATEASIPRAYLYAIARHESAFVRTARSNAGAIGLVQVLPTVARRIAELYGMKVRRKWALKRPAYNLSIGARYLSELQRFYTGIRPLASAGYNAGPYAVRRWLARTGPMATDAFVESIPFPGARRYAMRVGATAQSYAWLYPQWGEINAIAAGRKAVTPARLGPFMQGPAGQTSMRWPAPSIARPRRLASL
jgi:soluble lytic murein transglycosylase